MKSRKTPSLLVIPTTHWDRAWYWSFERFRIKLIEMWEGVKEMWERYPDYTFNADGQTLCVEDYLNIFPEDCELFQEMGRQGRLGIGALYGQSDLYCTGGEALIRNLQIGLGIADKLNARQNIAYMPDSFGHTPSVPMILQGFGIDTYTFMRGINKHIDSEARFWFWEAADGSRVQVFRMRDGYGNASRLGLHSGTPEIVDLKNRSIKPVFNIELAIEQIRSAAEKQMDGMGAPYVLNAGVDHQIPQSQLPDIMHRGKTDTYTFKYGTWNKVMEAMRKKDHSLWQVYRGELHGEGGSANILGGTVSSRIYLKQRNVVCERVLLNAENIDAVATLIGKSDSAGRVLKHAWKTLLKCQPHDNITGCSIDAVHREDEANFARSEQAADAVIRKMSTYLLEHYGGQEEGDERYAFFLFNCHSAPITHTTIVRLDHEGRYKWGDMPVHEIYDIVDEEGNSVPFREISRKRTDEHPHPVLVLQISVNLPPFSFNRFFLEQKESWNENDCNNSLENEFLKAEINTNSSVSLTDKTNGKTWSGLCLFSNQADCGDEYDFSHIENDHENIFDNLNLTLIPQKNSCNRMQTVELSGNLPIPQTSTIEGRAESLVDIPISIIYTLAPAQRQLDVRLKFTNIAKNHRLRLNIHLPFTPEKSHAGLKFNEVERPSNISFTINKNDRKYVIDPIYPMDHYVAVEDTNNNCGIAIFSEFPCNYEVVKESSRLAITILRAVGMLSHETLTRSAGAGPDTHTPDAQCLGREFEMCFGLRPFTGNERGNLLRESFLWRQNPVFGIIMGFDPPRKNIENKPLLHIDNNKLLVSSFKQTFKRDGSIVLRLFNPTADCQNATLTSSMDIGFSPVRLDETDLKLNSSENKNIGECRFTIPPFGLFSVKIFHRKGITA